MSDFVREQISRWRGDGGIVLLGILFIAINARLSYEFHLTEYHKLWMAYLSTVVICFSLILRAALGTLNITDQGLKLAGCLALPALLSIPGRLTTVEDIHFYASFEASRVLILVIWALALTASIRSPRSVRILLASLALSSGYVTAVELLRAFGLLAPASLADEATGFATVFGNPNFSGAFLAPLCVLFIGASFAEGAAGRHWVARVVWISAAAWCALGVAVTGARGPLLALFFCVVLYGAFLMVVRTRDRRNTLLIVVATLFLGGLYLATTPSVRQELAALADSRVFDDRLPPWLAAASMVTDAPVLGHGLGSFPELYGRHVPATYRAYGVWGPGYFNHAHSEPLQVLVEGGVLALAGYFALYAWAGLTAVRGMRRPSSAANQVLIPAVALAVLAGFGIGLISVTSRHISANLVMVTCLALLVTLPRALCDPPKLAPLQSRSRTWVVLGILCCGMIVAYGSLIPWLGSFGTLRAYQRALKAGDAASILALEERMRDAKNPRLRHALLRRLYVSGDLEGVADELRRYSSTDLYYRDTRLHLAYVQLMRGDLTEAERLARDYQARDLYHEGASRLLATLAVHRQDLRAFEHQVDLMTQFVFYKERVLPMSEPQQIRARVIEASVPVQLLQDETGYVLNISRSLLTDFGSDEDRTEQVVARLMSSEPVTRALTDDALRPEAGIRRWVAELATLLDISRQ